MENKNYESPKVDVIFFSKTDVVATSGCTYGTKYRDLGDNCHDVNMGSYTTDEIVPS